MLSTRIVSSLYDYGEWVNARLLDTAQSLSAEQLTQKFPHSFESVLGTFAHMLRAEQLWFLRWQGQSPQMVEAPQSLAELRARWASLIPARRAYLAALDDAQLNAEVSYTNMRGESAILPRWQMIVHCANHATHHRAELAAMLTDLGHAPPVTDLSAFYIERAASARG